MKKVLSFAALILPLLSSAQESRGPKAPDLGYQLDFRIKELKDTTVFLGYYYGESTFVRDTAKSDKDGKFSFIGSKRLDRGVYFLVLNRTKLFEPGFVVGQDQHFLMESSGPEYIRNMKVTGDEDNRLFFENMLFNGDRHKEAEPFIKILKDSTLTEAQKKDAREGYVAIDRKVQDYQAELVKKYPQTVTAKLVNANRRIEVPDPPRRADGTIDSLFQYRYYKKHFFDNFDITDDALIRLPSPDYQEKVAEYLDKLVMQTPDSLMAAIDDLAKRVKVNQETYKYLVYSCVYKYQRPAIMGLDEVFVRLYDKYYASGEMDFWVNPAMKKTMKDHANKLRNSLVGKTGANLVMQDQFFQKRALYDIRKKYAIVYFFDPDCGHCKEETPRLVNFYTAKKDKFNLEVFAVSLDTSMVKMRNYIRDMKMTWVTVNGPRSYQGSLFDNYFADTTPMLYILNENKKIIAKGLPAERVEEFLINYEIVERRRAALKPPGNSPGK